METLTFICPSCNKVNKLPKKESYKKANCGYCKNSLLNALPLEADDSNLFSILNSVDVPVVVDFWASWCGPCQMMAPAFKEASSILSPRAQFVKVNTEIAQQVSAHFGISSIPTIIVFKNGQEVQRVSGALPPAQIVQLAQGHI
jgi:thioredoxin 2